MIIFRFSLAAVAVLLILGAGYTLSEYRHAQATEIKREKIAASAKIVRNAIVSECKIPEIYLVTRDELGDADLAGYKAQPITLAPEYGFCPEPENDGKIACATRVAARADFVLGRPAIIGECPRLGIVE